QSTSRITFRHQSGPPPCSAPKTSVPALLAALVPGPLTLAEPVAASASAASTTPAKSQSLRRCIYSLRSLMGTAAAVPYPSVLPPSSGVGHSDRQRDACNVALLETALPAKRQQAEPRRPVSD